MDCTRLALAPALLGALFLAACSSGGGGEGGGPGAGAVPSMAFVTPTDSIVIELDEPIAIRWTADALGQDAAVTIVARPVAGGQPQVVASSVPVVDGFEELVDWLPVTGTSGAFRLEGSLELDDATVEAVAPGLVGVGAMVSGAVELGYGGVVVASDHFPDGSTVAAGLLLGGDPVILDSNGPGEALLDSDTIDAFVVRYGAVGEILWARQTLAGGAEGFSAEALAEPWDVVALDDGSAVVSVGFYDQVTVGLGTPAETTYVAETDEQRCVLVCYDAQGDVAWSQLAFEANGATRAGVLRLAHLGGQRFAVGAGHEGPVTLAANTALETTLTEQSAIFLALYDGQKPTYAGSAAEGSPGAVLDFLLAGDEHGVWFAGRFAETLLFGENTVLEQKYTAVDEDVFAAHFDSLGELVWSRHPDGVAENFSGSLPVSDLEPDGDGGVFLVHGPKGTGTYTINPDQPSTGTTIVNGVELLVLSRFDGVGERLLRESLVGTDFTGAGHEALAVVQLADLPDGVALFTSFSGSASYNGLSVQEESGSGRGPLLLLRVDEIGEPLWMVNDGGDGVALDFRAGLEVQPGGALTLLGAGLGALEFGTAAPVGVDLAVDGYYFIYRAVYGADGAFMGAGPQ